MAGTWQALNPPPTFRASNMLLLTDGTVMCQDSGSVNWHKLTPDSHGDYLNGSWTALAPMINSRLYYASAVLQDGRVIVGGGEYSDAGAETNHCEIYDPIADTWIEIAPPAGWATMGDAPCAVLPDGRLLVGYNDDTRTAIYDPIAGSWSAGPTKGDSSAEETWTLLPDSTVLAVQCSNPPFAEKYVAAANAWVSAGTLPVNLVEVSSTEVGPAILMPDGRTFCIGATNKTALYTMPPIANQAGSWTAGPQFPDIAGKNVGAKDAPACLLPNGKVLLVGGPIDGLSDSYFGPTYFFEFDGSVLTRIADPGNAGGPPFVGRMLLLPTGQVLFTSGSQAAYCYTPDGAPQDAWRPSITGVPTSLRAGESYVLYGRQLNGLSQAVSYGDDVAAATNYPLVRIRNLDTDVVTYCRTFDHSSMGVATGSAIEYTNFLVPDGISLGRSEICVIANGISSINVSVTVVQDFVVSPHQYNIWNRLIGSLADGPLWVWGPHGPVPVGPWGLQYAQQAQEARALMLKGMREMTQLGDEVTAARAKAGAAVKVATDPHLNANLT